MNSDKKNLLILSCSLLLSSIIALLIPNPISRYFLTISLIIFVILFIFLVKKRKIFSIYKKQVFYIFIVAGIVYLTLYYLIGIKFGFYKTNPSGILIDGLPLLISVICFEIIRNIIVSQENKAAVLLYFIAFIIGEIVLLTNLQDIKSFYAFMDLIGMVLLPSIMFNVLYHNISKEYGFYPNIGLRVILILPTIAIPFDTYTPDSLISIINLIYPLVLLELINLLYQKKRRLAIDRSFKLTPIVIGVLIVVSTSFALLVSNQFDYGALVIATESMTGEINKGDFVIFEKIEYSDELKEGCVIVFKKEDNYIVHRLVGIENIDSEDRYYTKGDANESNDAGYITRSDIVGVTQFKISYIGYPTLWLRELFD